MPEQFCVICEKVFETEGFKIINPPFRGKVLMLDTTNRVVHNVLSVKQTEFKLATGRVGCRKIKEQINDQDNRRRIGFDS